MATLILAQLAAALAAAAWLAFGVRRGKRAALCAVGAVALLLAGLRLAGVWVYPPAWSLWIVAGLSVLAAASAWRRAPAKGAAWAALFVAPSLLFASLGAYLCWQGIVGRIAPRQGVDLAAPLDIAGACVVSGGASSLLNFHLATLARGRERFRGQSYGVDFIAVSRAGFRTAPDGWRRPAPAAPDNYLIFGAPIGAPCEGAVIAAADGLPDQRAGTRDRAHMPGNHVILRCGDHDVLLAHMKQGSVRVRAGERTAVGDVLGAVGNTGNTDEPHLHVSAQRAGSDGLSGDPLHVTFGGRFLARGDCLSRP